ncbi:MAG: glycine cleavage system aminomethyltransferase GcvT [Actinomycetota bacterium]
MRFSPLDAQHRLLDAKMVPFGGWDMPLAYPSGTLAEHAACRTGAVIFDVSHLGTVRVEGPTAFDQLQACLTNDLSRIAPGRAQYTHLLDKDDASVLDDIIVWWVSDHVFDVMPNASNTDRVLAAIGGSDTTATRAVIAVQGPEARVVVEKVCVEAAAVKRFTVEEVQVCGFSCVVAGTGYTGEDGIEIAVPSDGAAVVWNALCEAGAIPAGLGARDTLRLEAGLPLHGHELGEGISSLQAGLEWVVAWNKPNFHGREALLTEKEQGVSRRLVGISIPGRRPARDGTRVLDSAGNEIGSISSGNFSPTLGHCVAMAFVKPSTAVGDYVSMDVRGTLIEGVVVATPFVAKKK